MVRRIGESDSDYRKRLAAARQRRVGQESGGVGAPDVTVDAGGGGGCDTGSGGGGGGDSSCGGGGGGGE